MTLPDKLELLARAYRENLFWEYSDCNKWRPGDCTNIDYVVNCGYEIRLLPPPPAPVFIPLGPQDVPPGSVVQVVKPDRGWRVPVVVAESGIVMAGFDPDVDVSAGLKSYTWERLMELNAQILRPGGVWEPCRKLQQS